MAVLETRNLCHIYGEGTPFEKVALNNINFSIEQGEIVGIMGHTGSGKSSLISHLNGLLKPSSGEILYNGENIWEGKIRDVRFDVGLVFQYPEYQLFEETVARDIAFGPKNMGLSQEEIDKRVDEAMEFVNLSKDLKEKSPFELSGGQKRRVAIAGVIAMEPSVLVLDEPTAGLDPKSRDEVLSQILNYHKEKNASIIFVTHSMEDLATTVDRIFVMNKGENILDEPPTEIFKKSKMLTDIGLSVPQITEVFRHLKELGVDTQTDVYTVKYATKLIQSMKGGLK
ncbi:MAG: energy-coupling factor transporter ATPase [Clostridia bacterium]